jgi:hypothetical protein
MRGGDAMTGVPKRSGLNVRLALVLGVIAVIVFGGAAAWAFSVNGDLERTRTTLGTTNADLATTTTTLADTETKLQTATSDSAAEEKAMAAADAKITVLNSQIKRKAACIVVQTTNLTELRRILALERDNFARTTTGSAWSKANTADSKAIHLAITDLYKAYQAAAARNYSGANTWLARSNAQVTVSNRQLKVANREIDRINKASKAINSANRAFGDTLSETQGTCGG